MSSLQWSSNRGTCQLRRQARNNDRSTTSQSDGRLLRLGPDTHDLTGMPQRHTSVRDM